MPYAFTEQGVAMPNTHQLRWKHSVYHTTASFALMMTYIISELPLKTWAKKWFGFSKMEMLTRNELVNRINKT